MVKNLPSEGGLQPQIKLKPMISIAFLCLAFLEKGDSSQAFPNKNHNTRGNAMGGMGNKELG
jgi:hypothetical protein